MECPFFDCGDRSSAGLCRSNRQPDQCAYGKRELRVQDAQLRGIEEGLGQAIDLQKKVLSRLKRLHKTAKERKPELPEAPAGL